MQIEVDRMKALIEQLTLAGIAYYKNDSPIMTDKQYDALYDELVQLEQKTEIILAGSPTQKVQGQLLDGFQKISHTRPMLSAQKTKNPAEIARFCKEQSVLLSWKLDGLTLVLTYENGVLTQGVTRGDGEVGEDVTAAVRLMTNVPVNISYKGSLQLRGEGVISYGQFESINAGLEVPYSSARNLAAGTVRQLNTALVSQRKVQFIAFQLVECELPFVTMSEQFSFLMDNGFQVVEHFQATAQTVEEKIQQFNPKEYAYPVDGLVVSYDNLAYGAAQGETAHHPNHMMALKWEDETKQTTLLDIELNPTRTGRVSLTAVFEPVEIDGAVLRRATLHNVDIMEAYQFGIGDTIAVYRSNMVIPAVDQNLTKSGTYQLPTSCPCCGATLEIKAVAETRELFCPNDKCPAKQVRQFAHFVSKHGMNIDGLSEQTLEKFIDAGFIHKYKDIFEFIPQYRDQLIELDGFGEKSIDNLQEAINKSKTVRLDKFLTALGIANIGRAGCKTLAQYVGYSWNSLCELLENDYDFTELSDFGEVMSLSLKRFYEQEKEMLTVLVQQLSFEVVAETVTNQENPFYGKTMVATGKLVHFTRDSIKQKLEELGATVTSSVSAKTDYLLAGEKAGSKLAKATGLNVTVLTEEEFLSMI